MKFWNIIETAPEAAAAKSWQQWLDGQNLDAIPVHFDSVKGIGLLRTGCLVDHLPCAKCGCNHRVQGQGNRFTSICECGKACEDMRLSAADVSEWQLNLKSLGKAVARDLGFKPILEEMGLNRTIQIALHGVECLPIILTIQPNQESFRNLVCQLAVRLPGGFILLAPTKRFADDGSLMVLAQANAKFFDLESNLLRIWSNGRFKVRMSGEELILSCSQPTSGPASDDEAGRIDQVVSDIHKKISAVESGVGEMLRRGNESQTPLTTPTASVGGKAVNRTTTAAGGINGTAVLPSPRYLLRRGAGLWRVVFDGMEGEIKFGRGISLVAYLLFNPPLGGLHGTELAKLAFGHEVVLEASLGADGDSTLQLIREKAIECMAVLRDRSASAIENAEAKEELEQLADALKMTGANSEGGADKQVRAVRRAIDRLIDNLREAKDRKDDPNLALRAFGEHLHKYLWIPSARFSGNRHSRTRAGVAGTFTYERPDGIMWE